MKKTGSIVILTTAKCPQGMSKRKTTNDEVRRETGQTKLVMVIQMAAKNHHFKPNEKKAYLKSISVCTASALHKT